MQRLYSFETEAEVAQARANHVRLTRVREGATHGRYALQVEFLPKTDWPNLMFRAETAWDWSAYSGLAFDLTNPTPEPIVFGVRVDEDPRADGVRFCRQGGATIPPKQRIRFVMPLAPNPMDFGMRGLPALKGYQAVNTTVSNAINLSHIVAFQIFLDHPQTPKRLIVDNIHLIRYYQPLEGIVDEFGQYAHANWAHKVRSIEHMRRQLRAEQRELERIPDLPERDRFGGWATGPKREATGYFRVEKVDGKWAFITPDGTLFLSIGMDCVNWGEYTYITGREKMFRWLPDEKDPLAKYYAHLSGALMGPIKEGKAYNFFLANLERKYGERYREVWREHTLRRLRAWGFNTIANWSASEFYRNGKIPYVATVGIWGDHKRVRSGVDYWGKMHDPFDEGFQRNLEASVRQVASQVGDDPWCLGYFVDNELSWGADGEPTKRYGLAYGALELEASESPAKRALIEQLHRKYRTIEALNKAWQTTFPSWDALERPHDLRSQKPTPECLQDLRAYVKAFALQYFRSVRETLRRYAPNHLYLGCRFAWYTPEAVEAAAETSEVLGFNFYVPRIERARWKFLEAYDRPILSGEFHFGALDRGMFHTGLVPARNQQERAQMYAEYVRSVVEHPYFVGCHWFQYIDQPLTGRWFDGENYNIGFITITDTPYPEMVSAARAIHQQIYRLRWG